MIYMIFMTYTLFCNICASWSIHSKHFTYMLYMLCVPYTFYTQCTLYTQCMYSTVNAQYTVRFMFCTSHFYILYIIHTLYTSHTQHMQYTIYPLIYTVKQIWIHYCMCKRLRFWKKKTSEVIFCLNLYTSLAIYSNAFIYTVQHNMVSMVRAYSQGRCRTNNLLYSMLWKESPVFLLCYTQR